MAATFHATGNNDQHSSSSFSVTTTITAGDGVVVFGSWDQASTTTPTVATTGGTGSDNFTLIYGPFTSGTFKYAAWLLQSAGTGRTGATLTWASSNPAFADAFCDSFSGLPNPTLDGIGFAAGSGTTVAVSADTATLLSADEFAIGYTATGGSVTTGDAPWTYDGRTILTASGGEHQILTATTAIHSAFHVDVPWITFCLTFMAVPTLASIHFNVGQNSNPPNTRMVGY